MSENQEDSQSNGTSPVVAGSPRGRASTCARRVLAAVLMTVVAIPAVTGCLQIQSDPTLVCIRGHESANEPNPWAAYNPSGPYYGAYQWLQSSWDTAAAAVGRPDLVGLAPIEPSVSRWDQDAVTLAYHHMVGDGPWGNLCG